MKIHFTILLYSLFLPGVLTGEMNGLITDDVLFPPDYNNLAPPEQVGSTYDDPVFGTTIKRLTKCDDIAGDVLGGYFVNSEICYFNYNGSYFIAQENDTIDSPTGEYLISTFLFDGQTGERLKYIGRGSIRNWWIRWAISDHYTLNGETVYFDPVYHFYAYKLNEIRLYDVRDMSYVLLHTFDEYTGLNPAGGEGDLSDDGRFWVLSGDEQDLFVYDLVNDVKYPTTPFDIGNLGCHGGPGVDYATMSPGGDYVIVAWGTTPALNEQYHGIEVYDKNWNYIRQLYPGIVHWEVGIDYFGNEVIYTAAGYDFTEIYEPYGITPSDLISINIKDGSMRLLKKIDKWAHLMFSSRNMHSPEYAYVSYEDRYESVGEWYPFWGEIIEVPTDGSQAVRRLLHHRAWKNGDEIDKYYQPDINVNRQGTKMMYRSNYINQIGDLYFFDIGERNDHLKDSGLIDGPGSYSFLPEAAGTQGHQIDAEWIKVTGSGEIIVEEFVRPPFEPVSPNHINCRWKMTAAQTLSNQQIRLTFHYTDNDVSGLNENDLRMYRYSGETWQYVGGVINADENTITISTDSLGEFAIFEHEYPTITVKVILEGLYHADSLTMHSSWQESGELPARAPYADQRLKTLNPDNVVDWVSLELRAQAGGPAVFQRSFLLRKDGYLSEPDGHTTELTLPNVPGGNYYLLIRHRAHINVMNADMLSLSPTTTASWDFTSGGQTCYGTSQLKQVAENTWAVLGGDFNQDHKITTQDAVLYQNSKNNGAVTYSVCDVNGDGAIDQNDFNIWHQNARDGGMSNVP